jgi:hypothetical protein
MEDTYFPTQKNNKKSELYMIQSEGLQLFLAPLLPLTPTPTPNLLYTSYTLRSHISYARLDFIWNTYIKS